MSESNLNDPVGEPVRNRAAKRGALVLGSGTLLGFAFNLGRSILVARLLTVADYGIAGTFMAALNLLQMMSSFNFQLLLVQDRRGNDEAFGAAIKGLNVARQFLLAGLLLALGGPLATLMNQPDLAWAYRCMAIVPLLEALRHPDLMRMQRRLAFGPAMTNNVGAQVLSILALWPAVVVLNDYRVMLVVYAVQAMAQTAGSHLQAERPFRVGWDWAVAGQAVRFGWPLMLSGIVLFFVMQGDRLIVANFYTVEDLGLIAAVLTMVMPAVLTCAQIMRSYFLPVLSRHQDKPASFDQRAVVFMQLTLVVGLVAAIGFALLGPHVLVLAFGAKYQAGGAYAAAIGMVFSVQLMRSGPSIVALARGHSLNVLITNLVRVTFFAPAVGLAVAGVDLVSVILVGILGQLAALATGVALILRRGEFNAWDQMRMPYLLAGLCFAALLGATIRPDYGFVAPGALSAGAVIALLSTLVACRSLAREARIWLRRSPD